MRAGLEQEQEARDGGFRPSRAAVIAAVCVAAIVVLCAAFWPGIAEGLSNLSLPGEHTVFSCAAGSPVAREEVPADVRGLAQEHLSGRTGTPAERVELVSAELVIWGASQAQTALLTAEGSSPLMLAGYRLVLTDQGQRYRYYVKPSLGGLHTVPAQDCPSRS